MVLLAVLALDSLRLASVGFRSLHLCLFLVWRLVAAVELVEAAELLYQQLEARPLRHPWSPDSVPLAA